ncbi:MAG: glycosyltransferase family 2 protein [Candidatus Obscuribacterales bacterium]|nr:glycosyltransferase family 2 protein [Candidatus Obscuribacterales bacterium]
MTITVLIPTFNRPDDLHRCLEAISCQLRKADQVLIIGSRRDPSQNEIEAQLQKARLDASVIFIEESGMVKQINAGLDQCSCDIVAITDDDAAPMPDWLQRIEAKFAETNAAAVGGRDLLLENGKILEKKVALVGKVFPFGIRRGNHHLCSGPARDVDFLKGVNWAFSMKAIDKMRLDTRLKGSGAIVHCDLDFSLQLRKRGLRCIYDPLILVNHYPAARVAGDERVSISREQIFNRAHNETLAFLKYYSLLGQLAYCFQVLLLGTALNPGILQLFRLLPKEGFLSLLRFKYSLEGRFAAIQSYSEKTFSA